MCQTGYKGDPLHGCVDIDECIDNPCAYGAHCLNEKGGYKCMCARGMTGDPYRAGCEYSATQIQYFLLAYVICGFENSSVKVKKCSGLQARTALCTWYKLELVGL